MRRIEAKGDPLKPSRADYRIIRKILESTYSGKVSHIPEEYDRVIAVFSRAGGSWERLFGGSIDDIRLLKMTLRVAFKNGHLTRSPEWK